MTTQTTPPTPPAPKRRVYLVFSLAINPQTMQMLQAECAAHSNQGVDEIYLLLTSPGGDVSAGIGAYNVLRSLPAKIITHNMGNVDSIANILFLAGEERFAVRHATFMFHGLSFQFQPVQADQQFLTDKLESLNAENKKMAAIIADRTSFGNQAEIMALFTNQATKEVEFARTKGIIHRIEDPVIPKGSAVLVFRTPGP